MSFRLSGKIRTTTIIIDLLIFNLAFVLAYVVRYNLEWLRPVDFYVSYREYAPQQLLFTLLLAGTFALNRVWKRRRGEFWVDEVSRIIYASATALILLMAITFYFRPLAFSRLMLFWIWLFVVVFVGLARLLRRWSLRYLYRRGIGTDKAVVVGSGEAGRGVIRTLLARPIWATRRLATLKTASAATTSVPDGFPSWGQWPTWRRCWMTSRGSVPSSLPCRRRCTLRSTTSCASARSIGRGPTSCPIFCS